MYRGSEEKGNGQGNFVVKTCANNRTVSLIFASLFLAARLILLIVLLITGQSKYSDTYDPITIFQLGFLAVLALFDIGLIFGAYTEKTKGKRSLI